ncbi:MAG: sensor histidine kinase [Dysosmobacter sp.]
MEKKINDRHLDVEADIPDEPILVLGDNDMITQVIYNLLENAAKFAREGSTLYLGVAMMDGKARITVRNVGETIPAEELPLLFERFHKSDKSRSEDKDGYGLGLYIVKTILQQHKEEINVTSENGVTTFTFSLTTEWSDRWYYESERQDPADQGEVIEDLPAEISTRRVVEAYSRPLPLG